MLFESPLLLSALIRRLDSFEISNLVYFVIVQTRIKGHLSPQLYPDLYTTVNTAGPAKQVTHFCPLRLQRHRVHACCHTISQPRAPQIKYRYDLCPLSQPSHCMFSCIGVGQTPTAVVICLLTCVGGEGAKVSEMKMTRPDLIVVSICGLRQDVCLNVYLSICPSVSLLSWRRVFCQWVEALWSQSAIMGLI